MRIVSLLASGTEIVCGLGADNDLVGRSHECDNRDWVRRLPVCTRPAFDVETSSREINAEVSRRMKENEPLYYIDAE
jgi:iron complex transport system substrate-binding protein